MSLQEKINNRQNDEDMLKCQFAARHFYNSAENYSAIAFMFSLLSCLCIFLSNTNSALMLLPLLLDTFVFVFYYKMEKSVSAAAQLRNYFDDTVLGFNRKSQAQNEMRAIQQLIHKACSKNEADCLTQIANTGRDDPPGVKNWYEFSKKYADTEVVFECQTQNQWWNRKLYWRRMVFYIVIVLACFIGCGIIINYYPGFSLPLVICFGSFAITFLDRACENVRYLRLSIKIDDVCEILSNSKTDQQIVELQKLLESRRKLRVVELNHFHKKNSKKFSEEYEQISKDI